MWSLLDFLFPRRSLRDSPGMWVSPEEWRALQSSPVRLERPELRSMGIVHLDTLVAAGKYGSSELLRTAIHRFKYGRVMELGERLGQLLVRAAPLLIAPSDTVLCPVPLHRIRLYHRGFNQSLLLAEQVGHARGWDVCELLVRSRYTLSQTKRSGERRRDAMRHAFRGMPMHTMPEHIVLVDDVCTTGSTLDACAGALKQAGALHVEALVVAW